MGLLAAKCVVYATVKEKNEADTPLAETRQARLSTKTGCTVSYGFVKI